MDVTNQKRENARLRQAASRQRRREADPEKFKAQEAEKQKRYRAKRKAINQLAIPEFVELPVARPVEVKAVHHIRDAPLAVELPVAQSVKVKAVHHIREAQVAKPFEVKYPEFVELPVARPVNVRSVHHIRDKPVEARAYDKIDPSEIKTKEDFFKLFPRKRLNKPDLTDSSVKTYMTGLSSIYKHVYGKQFTWDNFDWMHDSDLILQKLRDVYPNASSFKSRINEYVASLARLDGFDKEYQRFSKIAVDLLKAYVADQEENKKNEKQDANWVSWQEILDARARIPNHKLMIYFMYTMQPPRRSADYRLMKISRSNTPIEALDTNFNYFIEPLNLFVFNQWKLSSSKGRQVIPVNEELSRILSEYMKNMDDLDFIFTDKFNKQFEQNSFSRYIKRVFAHVNPDKTITLQLLRRIYISHFLDNKLTVAKKKEIANKMGHSVESQSLYDKF
jgi:hypothetical protein